MPHVILSSSIQQSYLSSLFNSNWKEILISFYMSIFTEILLTLICYGISDFQIIFLSEPLSKQNLMHDPNIKES